MPCKNIGEYVEFISSWLFDPTTIRPLDAQTEKYIKDIVTCLQCVHLVLTSASFLAETSVRSLRKLLIFII